MRFSWGRSTGTAAAVAAGMVMLGCLGAPPALAASPSDSAASLLTEVPDLSSLSQLEAELDARGISDEAKRTILKAARNGTPLLAEDPDATPVSTQEVTRGTFAVTVRTFADGSFTETGIEHSLVSTSSSGISPMSVNGCVRSSVSGGYKYSGCEVYTWVGSISMSFHASYTILSNGLDKINSVSGQNISAPLYDLTGWTLKITRTTENSTGPAMARYHVDLHAVIKDVPINTSRNLYLNVGGNSAWDTFG